MFKIYENDYLIYSDGKVFSIKRNKFQKLRKHTNGYLRATIHGKDMYVHRLVAICFLKNENNYKEINHIDGDKTNNNVTNLEWCNRSQNNKHAFDTGLRDREFLRTMANCEKAVEAHKKRRTYNEVEVRKIRECIKRGMTDRQIVKIVGGSYGAIYQIRTGKTYTDIA